MTLAKDMVIALQQRLKDLTTTAAPDQLAYLAKALEAIAGHTTVVDILQMTDDKLAALLAAAQKYLTDLDASKIQAVAAVGNAQSSATDTINTLKATTVTAVQTAGTTQLAALDSRKDAHLAAIQSTGQGQLQAVTTAAGAMATINDVPPGSTIMTEVAKKGSIDPLSIPFLFGVLSRSNDLWGIANFTSELGIWANTLSSADSMLQLLAGVHTQTTNYAGFYRPPQLYFLQGQQGNFIYKELITKWAGSTNIYSYPYAGLGVMFVKNTTTADITRPLSFGGSTSWSSSYEGMSLYVGTPSHTNANKAQVTGLTWSCPYNNTSSNQAVSGTANILIPAGKTVAILLYTSAFYYSTVSGFYVQFMHWYITGFRTGFMTAGLEVDMDRTLKAWQCRGFANTFEIWR